MHKAKVKARELSDADVSHVSLVSRGANRAPFKILKSAEEAPAMTIDFRSIFKREIPRPAVAAIAVLKTADQVKAKARITAAGFSVEKTDESDDNVVVYKQVDQVPAKAITLKLDGATAVLMTNVAKMFEPYDGSETMFGEMIARQGFYPGVNLALEVFRDTVSNIMYQAADAGEASAKITAALGEMQTYISGLLAQVPITAFKLDAPEAPAAAAAATPVPAAVQSIAPAGQAGAPAEGTASEGSVVVKAEGAAETTETSSVEAAKSEGDGKTTETDAAGGAGAAAEAITPETSADPTAVVKGDASKASEQGSTGSDKDQTATAQSVDLQKFEEIFGKFTAGITEQIASVAKSVADVQASVVDLGKRVTSVEEVAKSADAAVRGTVVGGDASGDRPASSGRVAKGEVPLIDTAYERRARG